MNNSYNPNKPSLSLSTIKERHRKATTGSELQNNKAAYATHTAYEDEIGYLLDVISGILRIPDEQKEGIIEIAIRVSNGERGLWGI